MWESCMLARAFTLLFPRKMKSLSLLNPKMVSLFSQLFVLLMTRHYHSDSFSGSQG